MSRKINHSTFFMLAAIALMNCNSATSEFNAPTGAVATFTSAGNSADFPDTGTPGTCIVGGLSLATFVVSIPIGVPGVSEPGNKIQGVVTGVRVNIFKFKEDVRDFLPESSLVDPVAANTFVFVTNDRGLYTLAYRALGCYDAEGAILSGSAQVTADIGVNIGILDITIQ